MADGLGDKPTDEEWRERWEWRFGRENRPPSWWKNQNARPISMEGVGFLGIDEHTNRLHWNGDEIQTRRSVRLEGAALWAAWIGALAALIGAVAALVAAINGPG